MKCAKCGTEYDDSTVDACPRCADRQRVAQTIMGIAWLVIAIIAFYALWQMQVIHL